MKREGKDSMNGRRARMHANVADTGKVGSAGGPRVLIRTFPPNSNPNYGGILQAWALHTTINRLGFTSFVDSTRANRPSTIRSQVKSWFKRVMASRAPVRLISPSLWKWLGDEQVNRRILAFASEEIRQAPVYRRGGGVNRGVVQGMDAFVVGSDQVWRPTYMDVASNLFDFLPDDFEGPRVAYAASFGTSTPEFTADLITQTARLARKLTAVSVREDSGIDLCARLWNIEATHMPDPTLLIPREEYERLSRTASLERNGNIVTYLLDATPQKAAVVTKVREEFGGNVVPARPPQPASASEYRLDPSRFDRPGVKEWLALIASSGCLITDSFHGCVFALVFERPFLVVPNLDRGLARFESLLRTFGLEDRMIGPKDELAERMGRAIDWEIVRERVRTERERGLSFLRSSLDVSSRERASSRQG